MGVSFFVAGVDAGYLNCGGKGRRVKVVFIKDKLCREIGKFPLNVGDDHVFYTKAHIGVCRVNFIFVCCHSIQ